jgi:hypothetical protein
MRSVRVACALAFVPILCTGCLVQSTHPFFTRESVTPLPDAVGKWRLLKDMGADLEKDEKNAAANPWIIRAVAGGEVPSCQVTTYDRGQREGTLYVVFFTVNGETYGSVMPEQNPKASKYWNAGHCPVHTLCKVELKGDLLRLRFLNREWVERAVARKELAFPVAHKGNRSLLLSPAAEEWKTFLEKCGKTEGVFSERNPLELRRIKDVPPAELKPVEPKAQPEDEF